MSRPIARSSSCQTYEGGFGGVPGAEAHGGYTFCAVAALAILGKTRLLHSASLLKWTAFRQMRFEGGFQVAIIYSHLPYPQGRTNKLVDGCYSFWQAAVFAVLEFALASANGEMCPDSGATALFNTTALQEFILVACQAPGGGCRDKPDR